MLIFQDIIKNDEFMSDIFPYTLEYDDVIMKVQSSYKPKDNIGNIDEIIGNRNDFGGGEDQGGADDEPTEKVNDVVYNANLQPVTMSKKEFMAYIKDFFKKVVTYLEEHDKKDRVETFKKGATAFIKFIVPHFDDLELYTGSSHQEHEDVEGGIAIAYWEDESAQGPVLYFFKDALKEEKC